MHNSVPYYVDDDDDVPPGFEGRRQRPAAKQFSALAAGAPDCTPPADHLHQPQQGPAMTAYQPSYHQHNHQQQRWQTQPPPPPPAHANGVACSSSTAAHSQPLMRHGSDAGAALGGARQFQRALSGSVSAILQQQQQQTQLIQQTHSPTHRQQDHRLQSMSPAGSTPASFNASTPDYGEYGDSDTEYGAPSRSSTRKARGMKSRPATSSSTGPPSGAAYSSSYTQQQQRSLSGSPKPSSHRASSSPTRPGHTAAAGAGSGRGPKPGGYHALPDPVPDAAHQPGAAVRPAAAAGGSSSSSAPACPPQEPPFPQPDYGEFDDDAEYGQDVKGRRRRGARSGSSSRPRSGSRGPEGSPAPEAAAAAAAQALAGITSPAVKLTRKVRAGHQGAPRPQRTPLSAERTSQLEAELAALRARLLEAEAREVEAHMAVISLSSDNTSLQAQLSGMRQQKQQLEQMLLFGSDPQDSEEDMGDYSSTPSAQSEGSLGGTPEAAAAQGAAQQQQQEEEEGGEELSLGTQDASVSLDGGAANEQVVSTGGGLSSPGEQAASGGATELVGGAAAQAMSRSLSEEIAEALAAAEAAGEAAVTAGK